MISAAPRNRASAPSHTTNFKPPRGIPRAARKIAESIGRISRERGQGYAVTDRDLLNAGHSADELRRFGAAAATVAASQNRAE